MVLEVSALYSVLCQRSLWSYLQADGHELHTVVGLTVPQLCSEVGQQPLGRASPHPRQEVMGDIGESETVEGELPAVVQATEVQREPLDVWVAVG